MVRPRIGVLLDVSSPDGRRRIYELNADYPDAILRAGGTPVLLPQTQDPDLREQMIAWVDGLMIPGGNDLDPRLFGQEPHPRTKLVDAGRQRFDLAMLSLAERRGLPVLGICLGCQVMNVHRRGTLHQHLPDVDRPEAIEHTRPGDPGNFHAVSIRPGTHLARIYETSGELQANSRHHQAIASVGQGLIASAMAADGVVEAVEDPSLPFFVAVQWHPENLRDSEHEKLFAALVTAAGQRSAAR